MVEMGKSRCILYFDELDKACSKHGNINEISSILIHLTDPNMNKSFQDRFFQGIDFPLDKVIMIFSYNDSKLIDPILLDRLTEIKVKPYSTKDKIEICNKHIIPEINNIVGLPSSLINWTSSILEYIVSNYTNEAGVRGIKRIIEKICMNININRLKQEGVFKNSIKKLNITKKIITDIMKEPYNDETVIHCKNEIGIINGLYATTSGMGGIIPIQIFKNFSGNINSHDIKLTGNQGDVMKESVLCSLTTALNYIEKNKKKFNIPDLSKYMEKNFRYGFHVHTPSTSTPKDGPSAGCAFTCAFISLILQKAIKNIASLYVSADYISGLDQAEASKGHLIVADAIIGKSIVNSTTCITCHNADEPSIGPSFTDIAKKYRRQPNVTTYLLNKIQKGGSGVWGETVMPANTELKNDDATKIISYIMSLGQKEAPKPSLPAKGIVADPLLGKTFSESGMFVLNASFTDRGGKESKPLSGNGSVVLKSPKLGMDQAKNLNGFSIMKYGGQTLMMFPSTQASFSLNDIDLIQIIKLQIAAAGQEEGKDGYSIEVRLDSPTGKVLGSSIFKLTATGPKPPYFGGCEIKLTPVTDKKKHTLYFVTKPIKEGEPAAALVNIEFKTE